jgi:hypothetical protein
MLRVILHLSFHFTSMYAISMTSLQYARNDCAIEDQQKFNRPTDESLKG